MRIRRLALILLAAGVVLPAAADSEKKDPGKLAQKPAETESETGDEPLLIASNMPVFVPPNRGAPAARLGGATRSPREDGGPPRIEALVPEEAGWTLRAQPVLYWHLGKASDAKIEFVLLQVDAAEPLVEASLPAARAGGVQRIDLAQLGAELETGASYQWLVKLVVNPDDRSYDRIVGGGIERVETSPELAAKLAEPGASRPHVLAEGGIWYDALDELSQQIQASPDDPNARQQRVALLAQVGLPELVHQ